MKETAQRFALLPFLVFLTLTNAACQGSRPKPSETPSDLPIDRIRLPAGFSISVFAAGVDNARQMAWSPAGVLYVGSRNEGKVYALPDRDGDWRADSIHVIASDLDLPSGVAYRDGTLWVAEVSRILRWDDIDRHFTESPKPTVVRSDFPTEHHHGWKFLGFGPDGKLYVPVCAPCNVCPLKDLFGTITRISPSSGEAPEIVARGVRNSVGFDWHPVTREAWFTDNGRDLLGDDLPADELNRVANEGEHFGFPYCHAGDLPDPDLDRAETASQPCSQFVPPAQKLTPHGAAIGMRFYDGQQFPAEYKNAIFIAEHGSWNRSKRIGYRVAVVRLGGVDGNTPISYEGFAEGWLENEDIWGRPADVEIAPDGSLLISDDAAGAIYRISYRAP